MVNSRSTSSSVKLTEKQFQTNYNQINSTDQTIEALFERRNCSTKNNPSGNENLHFGNEAPEATVGSKKGINNNIYSH